MAIKLHRNVPRSNPTNWVTDTMPRTGSPCTDSLVFDGKPHWHHIEGDIKGSKNGCYILSNHGFFAGILCSIKSNQKIKVCSTPNSEISDWEREIRDATFADADLTYQKELENHGPELDLFLRSVLSEAADPNHTHLSKYKILTHHFSQERDKIQIPAELGCRIVDILTVSPTGTKEFLLDAPLKGAHCSFGSVQNDSDIIIISIDFETAASNHEITGYPTAASLTPDNLRKTVLQILKDHPNIRIKLAATNDQLTDGTPLATLCRKIAEEFNIPLIFPIFQMSSLQTLHNLSTLNDMARLYEIKQLTELISNATSISETIEFLVTHASSGNYAEMLARESDRWGMDQQALVYRTKQFQKYSENMAIKFLKEITTPWFCEVDGAGLANEYKELLSRHAELPSSGDVVLTLWALSTYVHDAFQNFPLCIITSPQAGSGKSVTLSGLTSLCMDTLKSPSLTPPVIYRMLQQVKFTLLLDEGDCYLPSNRGFVEIFNASHMKDAGEIYRCGSKNSDFEPDSFKVWAPIVISMLNAQQHLSHTNQDRAITILMKKMMPNTTMPRMPSDFFEQCKVPRRQAQRWAADNFEAVKKSDPHVPNLQNRRSMDNWRPLLAVADVLGGEWPKLALTAMSLFEASNLMEEEIGTMLLTDIKSIFATESVDRIYSCVLLEKLHAIEVSPWNDYQNGKKLTDRQLAGLLRGFGIIVRDVRNPTPRKGYRLEWFEDAFARYVHKTTDQVVDISDVAVQPAKVSLSKSNSNLLECGLPRWKSAA